MKAKKYKEISYTKEKKYHIERKEIKEVKERGKRNTINIKMYENK